MNKVICSIPHAGMLIPRWARKDIELPDDELYELVSFMADKNMDRMWSFVPRKSKVVTGVSRVVVDAERFKNDAQEPMSRIGMGMFYTKTPDGKPFRSKDSRSYEKCARLYNKYHRELDRKVGSALGRYKKCVILDCHSFHDAMEYTGYDPCTFPDVCIGVNGAVSPEAELITDIFSSRGYSVKINEPFAGALVPTAFLPDDRVCSVMIELNRRIYDNDNFSEIQELCRQIYEKIKLR